MRSLALLVFFFGHSWSAHISIHLAASRPDLVHAAHHSHGINSPLSSEYSMDLLALWAAQTMQRDKILLSLQPFLTHGSLAPHGI